MTFAILDELETFGPQRCTQLDYAAAATYTRRLAATHYENFTVVSWFLPRRLREDFAHVYAFCRWSDDLGDEIGDRQQAVELLNWWRQELDRCYDGRPRHPVYVALERTIKRFDIPRKPFDDLIDAFVADQTMTRYQTWDQVLDYCTRSANPVGRLVLYMVGHRDEQRQALSDQTCTALQLANFWQDVRRDVLEHDRVYVPSDIASQHGLSIELMVETIQADAANQRDAAVTCQACPPSVGLTALAGPFAATNRQLVAQTWPLFTEGRKLWPLLEADVRLDIKLFTLGGEAVLRMIHQQGYDTLSRRPRLSKPSRTVLMLRAVAGKLGVGFSQLKIKN
jgi:squalene synthase HpnC